MMSDELEASLYAQINEKRKQVAELREQVVKLRAQLDERDALIAQVTKILGGYSDSDLLSLARTVAIGYQQWSDNHDAITDDLRAQLAERDAEIYFLRERVSAWVDTGTKRHDIR